MKVFTCLLLICCSYNLHAQTDTVTHAGFFTSFDGAKIYYEAKGSGYPVLLVHGFTGNGSSWKKAALYNELLNNGYKVITIDLRGNGKSDKPHEDAAYANDAEAKDIMGLLKSLGVQGYDVLGYSRGSIITARLLVLDSNLHKAILGGMGADFTNPEWPRRKMFYRALSGDTVKELEPMIAYVKKSGFDQQALALQQKYQPSTSKEELGKLNKPVLLICGTEDSDNGSAKELQQLIPNAGFTQVPGDHGRAMNTPEFASATLQFFK